jgi:hypothetical protein
MLGRMQIIIVFFLFPKLSLSQRLTIIQFMFWGGLCVTVIIQKVVIQVIYFSLEIILLLLLLI